MQVSNEKLNAAAVRISEETAYAAGEKVPCRDPFILPCGERYYLYRSAGERGVECLTSRDLAAWSKPVTVFAPPPDFHGIKDFFWAPEVHEYRGKYYLFTSVFSARTNHRNVSVYRADSPLGPFADIADGCVGKPEWDTIDGTLFLDDAGDPWMIFVHEWTSIPEKNGRMCAVRLTEDLSAFAAEPIDLFRAKDPEWARHCITDGPYPIRLADGSLGMIWSNFSARGYVIALAKSDSGRIDGAWRQCGLLYEKGLRSDFAADGGHGMIFRGLDGVYRLAIHTPNQKTAEDFEHLRLIEVEEKEGTLCLR